ncbi:gluconate 2-dehydrogenase subunit 3 family protein [Chitinophaga sp. MM2321]|uniref:gluconate 2-dehydrogenase subunit 3 family protein n=1 Tax=Chitinophaga sp. MM2321 TaxID=3137178 RepID=UPI0032D58A86
MERRAAIRNLLIISGGITLLPSCLGTQKKQVSAGFSNLDISADQEKLLAEIAETIIPATDTPGAKALGVHLFVLKMLNDCYEKDQQEAFIKGLKQLEKITKKQYGDSFMACDKVDREAVLKNIETTMKDAGDVSTFYKIMKQKTIQGYLNSKYVMTNLVIYELVPGRYDGYFPVKNT